MQLPARSLEKLKDVHEDLKRVILHAADTYQSSSYLFIVTEGLRSKERQRELFLARKSTTMNSRHLTGHAVDLAIWEDRDQDKVVDADELSWKFAHYQELADHIKKTAQELGIKIAWGGDWTTFKDGPHFELDRHFYPQGE